MTLRSVRISAVPYEGDGTEANSIYIVTELPEDSAWTDFEVSFKSEDEYHALD